MTLDGLTVATDAQGLLKDFPNLRQLSANDCKLRRLPESIGKMTSLETLHLNDNAIQLTPADVESLRNLTRMESLRLDNSPLGASIISAHASTQSIKPEHLH